MAIKINQITLSNPIQRILTGIVLTLAIIFVITRENSLFFTMVLIFVVSWASYEWAQTVGFERLVHRLVYSLITLVITTSLIFLVNHQIALLLASLTLVYISLCALVLVLEERALQLNLNLQVLWQAGGFVIIPISSVVLLTIFRINPMYFAYFLIVVCSIDTFCYVGGKLLGKTQFVPLISPNKTVEGLLVGFIVGFLIFYLINFSFNLFVFDIFGINGAYLLIFLGAILGDLNVSIMKRKSGKKNTGRIFPGHGGVLDRVDSILFGGPCFLIALSSFRVIL